MDLTWGLLITLDPSPPKKSLDRSMLLRLPWWPLTFLLILALLVIQSYTVSLTLINWLIDICEVKASVLESTVVDSVLLSPLKSARRINSCNTDLQNISPFVCMCVRLSNSGIVSKRLDLSFRFLNALQLNHTGFLGINPLTPTVAIWVQQL